MILTRKDIGIYGSNIIETLNTIINERENRKFQLERLLDSDEIKSTQRVVIRNEISDIDNRMSYAYETRRYLKNKIRFEKDVNTSNHRKRHRVILGRAEEIISSHIPAALHFPDLLKRMYDDVVDLYYQDIDESNSDGLTHYGLAQLYDSHFGDRRKAFEYYSESIDLSSDFNQTREFRIEISKLLISEKDELYIHDAKEALIEDLRRLVLQRRVERA